MLCYGMPDRASAIPVIYRVAQKFLGTGGKMLIELTQYLSLLTV